MDYLDSEIRTRLGRFLRREDTLDEFREWFIPATWDVHTSDNSAAEELAYRIVHLIGEHVAGQLTEGRLRTRLRPLIETHVVTYDLAQALQVQIRTQLADRPTPNQFFAARTGRARARA